MGEKHIASEEDLHAAMERAGIHSPEKGKLITLIIACRQVQGVGTPEEKLTKTSWPEII